MGASTGHLWDTDAQRCGVQMMEHSKDVPRTSMIRVFLNLTQKHFKLTLTGYSRLYSDF